MAVVWALGSDGDACETRSTGRTKWSVQPELGLRNGKSVGGQDRARIAVAFTVRSLRRLDNRHVPLDVGSVRPSAPNGLFDGLIWPKAG
jgi:hypothetical protein